MVGKPTKDSQNGLDRRTVLGTGAAVLVTGAGGGLIALRSPGIAQAQEPKRGGVLRLSTSEEPFAPAFDLHRTLSLLTTRIGYCAYNGLVNIDSNRNVVPDLAESWEQPDAADLHLQPAKRRQVPRRHRFQRRCRQVHGRAPRQPGDGLWVRGGLRAYRGGRRPRSAYGAGPHETAVRTPARQLPAFRVRHHLADCHREAYGG